MNGLSGWVIFLFCFIFQCLIPGCDWAFTTAYKLKRHMRGHTGEKPFIVSNISNILFTAINKLLVRKRNFLWF